MNTPNYSGSLVFTPGFTPSKLTPRELEVMKLMCRGCGNKQMAAELFLSVKTIEKHRQQVYIKTGIHEVVTLSHFALARGIVENLFAKEPTQ